MIDQYIRLYGRRLYGLCLTLCANRHDADDLYQDTWLKAMKSISQYDPSMAFGPWLTRICVNTHRNTLRRIARSPIFNAFANEEEKSAAMERIPAPEQTDYSPLYEAIDTLPEKLRTTVILFYFEDMDIASTAHILNIPPGTVKSRLRQARQRLKEVLHDEADLQF